MVSVYRFCLDDRGGDEQQSLHRRSWITSWCYKSRRHPHISNWPPVKNIPSQTQNMHFSTVSSALGLASLVSAHGVVLKPASRKPGDATTEACGRAMVNFYKQDETSYPEAFLRSNPLPDRNKCNLFLCKGYQFADNAANVQSYKPGDSVEYEVYIRIPHSGYANVSIVDTTTNKVLGSPLVSWASGYAASSKPPADQTKFSVKIPELGAQCTTAGVCVSSIFYSRGRQKTNHEIGPPVALVWCWTDISELHRLYGCRSCCSR